MDYRSGGPFVFSQYQQQASSLAMQLVWNTDAFMTEGF